MEKQRRQVATAATTITTPTVTSATLTPTPTATMTATPTTAAGANYQSTNIGRINRKTAFQCQACQKYYTAPSF